MLASMAWGHGRTRALARHGWRAAFAMALTTVATVSPDLRAQSESAPPDPMALQVHAFVSQGFIKSSTNNYLTSSQRGSFEFTEVGINVTKDLVDDLRIGVQLFARDVGPLGQYAPQFDWYYLDYRFRDWLGVRAGRTKIPFGLYNDSSEIDSARVPVLLPQSVYPIDHQDYLLAQTGGEVYGNFRLAQLGGLEYRAYGGTLQVSTPASPTPGITVANLSVPYVLGGRLIWSTPVDGLQLGGTFQSLRLEWDYDVASQVAAPLTMAGLLPANFNGTLPVTFLVTLWIASVEYQTGNLSFAAEYSRWIGEFQSEAPALLPTRTVNERYYAMVSYRVARWFTPGAYYSAYYPNVHQRQGRQSYQHDLALTVRYDVNAHWLFKLEGHFMDGTAALDPSLNGGQDPKTLTKDWGLFLIKTTAYF